MTVSLHLGDWREVADSWPRPFVLVCDPPYGIAYRSNHHASYDGRYDRGKRKIADRVAGDRDTTERDAAMAVDGWVAAAVFGPRRIDRVKPWGDPREILVWDKSVCAGMGDLSLPWKPCWETVAIYGAGWAGPRGSGVLRGAVVSYGAETWKGGNGRTHPHEKPLSVLLELVGKAPPGLPIVDPFAGSGVTGAACMILGRDFYGAEIDPEHHRTAAERLALAPRGGPGGQQGLFG